MIKARPISDIGWSDMVAHHPEAVIFHSSAWIDLLSTCYGYRPLILVTENDAGEVTGGLPIMEIFSWLTGHRWTSLPFSDYCPPLLSAGMNAEGFLEELLQWWAENGQVDISLHWPLPERSGVQSGPTFYHHMTDLAPKSAQILHTFDRKIPQFIHQAERAGVSIRQSCAWEDMALYYQFHLLTRKRLGVPSQSLKYFHLLWERVISQGMGFILLAYQGGRPLGGGVFLHWNKTLTAKYAASDPEYWHLRPNHLLFWTAMQWGCEHGCHKFDWGRTDQADNGLRNFKRGWAAQEQTLGYSKITKGAPNHGWFGELSQRMMKPVITHAPVWVCQRLGELFYGHFA